jgi:hypothetical protein
MQRPCFRRPETKQLSGSLTLTGDGRTAASPTVTDSTRPGTWIASTRTSGRDLLIVAVQGTPLPSSRSTQPRRGPYAVREVRIACAGQRIVRKVGLQLLLEIARLLFARLVACLTRHQLVSIRLLRSASRESTALYCALSRSRAGRSSSRSARSYFSSTNSRSTLGASV